MLDMTFSKRIRFLFSMLHVSANDLIAFSLVLLVLFLAFGLSGFIAFGTDVKDFRTFHHSVLNLFRFMTGDMDYYELASSSVILGSVYFCLWGIVILLMLANVFIAILTDAYGVVRQEVGRFFDSKHTLTNFSCFYVSMYSIDVVLIAHAKYKTLKYF